MGNFEKTYISFLFAVIYCRYIIQTWVESTDELPGQLLERGYELIMSTKNAWYFDHGFWGKTQYYHWHTVYENRLPLDSGVLGGEACVWSELIDNTNLGMLRDFNFNSIAK